MYDNARVLAVHKNGSVTVLPLIKGACINCTESGCAKRGSPFTAANPHSLPVKPGMTVCISAKPHHQAVQALVALFVPILCAVGGWFAADTFIAVYMRDFAPEWIRATGVLAGFFLSASIILFASRCKNPAQAEIIEII